MKRTTVLLPDEISKLVELEADRQGVSPSVVLRDAISAYVLAKPKKRGIAKIAGSFESGHADTSERADDILKELTASRNEE